MDRDAELSKLREEIEGDSHTVHNLVVDRDLCAQQRDIAQRNEAALRVELTASQAHAAAMANLYERAEGDADLAIDYLDGNAEIPNPVSELHRKLVEFVQAKERAEAERLGTDEFEAAVERACPNLLPSQVRLVLAAVHAAMKEIQK